MTTKFTYGIRAADSDQGDDPDVLNFVMSDESIDRYGDTITASGWQLANFKKNPTALYGHDGSERLPIGRWENVRVVGKALLGSLRFAKRGTSAFTDAIRDLFQQKILNAVSVGFLPLKSEPLDPEKPWDGYRYLKQDLLECSVVAVPANASALIQRALASTPADIRQRLLATSGPTQPARKPGLITAKSGSPTRTGDPPMTKLSEYIQADRAELIALNDAQADFHGIIAEGGELTAEQMQEFDRIEVEKSAIQKRLDVRLATERSLAGQASSRPLLAAGSGGAIPGIQAGPTERHFAKVKDAKERPMDTLVRLATVHLKAYTMRRPVDDMMRELYPERTDMDAVLRAVTNPAMTTVATWAAELVDTAILDFMEALKPQSAYAQLAARGVRFSFGRNGSVKIPRRNSATGPGAAPDLRGAFVGEGQPIPVRRGSFGSITLVPHKMGVISTFTKEMAEQSTPQIEGMIRQGMIDDTAVAIDVALLDAIAGDAIRPAGLMNGVTPQEGTAGGGVAAITGDLGKLIAPFTAANAADGIVILINPAKMFSLQWVSTSVGVYPFRDQAAAGTFGGYPVIASTNVAVTDIIAVRYSDFVTSTADSPEFDVSDVATLHEDDGGYPVDQAMRPGTSTVLPLATGTAGAGAITAAPVRSLWQTASLGIRMLLGMDWAMRRAGMVSKVQNITW
jgi:HK97 family phage major capsid protein/HK97 family phage prohead protease